jgi:hypothetical protein
LRLCAFARKKTFKVARFYTSVSRKGAKFAKLLFMGRSSYEWQGKAWIVNLRVLPTVPDGKSLSPLFSDVSKISCGVPFLMTRGIIYQPVGKATFYFYRRTKMSRFGG